MSEEIAGYHKKDYFKTVFINFLEELTKTWIDTLFSMYSATKFLFEVSISVLNKLILLFRHNFMICSYKWKYPASDFVKIDHQKSPLLKTRFYL